jgi:hypothetical protein
MIIEPKIDIQPEPILELDMRAQEIKLEWHAPLLTRIDIRKTLLNNYVGMSSLSEDLYLTN